MIRYDQAYFMLSDLKAYDSKKILLCILCEPYYLGTIIYNFDMLIDELSDPFAIIAEALQCLDIRTSIISSSHHF